MAFAWVMGWLANASGLDEIPGLVLSVVAVGIFAFLLFRRRPKPLKTEVLHEGNDLVFSFRRGMRQREPIAAIASYRFDSVWHLQLMMKDQTSRRIELPSLSWKPVIQKLMAEAGIPVSAG